MANIQKLMKQAAQMQQKMQQDMASAQEELAKRTVEHSSGGGAVTATATCDGSLSGIKIKPDVVDPEDVEMLEDLVFTAVKGALEEAQRISSEEMGKLTQGLNIPGMPGGMF